MNTKHERDGFKKNCNKFCTFHAIIRKQNHKKHLKSVRRYLCIMDTTILGDSSEVSSPISAVNVYIVCHNCIGTNTWSLFSHVFLLIVLIVPFRV